MSNPLTLRLQNYIFFSKQQGYNEKNFKIIHLSQNIKGYTKPKKLTEKRSDLQSPT
jgi:hypothetical protein